MKTAKNYRTIAKKISNDNCESIHSRAFARSLYLYGKRYTMGKNKIDFSKALVRMD